MKIFFTHLSFQHVKALKSTFYLLPFIFYLLTSCSEPQTGAKEIKWDRVACERCRMVLSDRKFSAQIRGGKYNKVFAFDDIGCALLWLDTQTWKNEPNVEIWVNDYKTGEWINAKTAFYTKDITTPMDYGLGAMKKLPANADKTKFIDFNSAKYSIFKQEKAYRESRSSNSR
jgi:hypothetical protein